MSKIRSLFILSIICVAMGIAWMAYASRSSATPGRWSKSFRAFRHPRFAVDGP